MGTPRIEFSFDAERHEYRIGNRILPSVTQVITLADESRWDTGQSAWYFKRGELVHKATELHDLDDLDPDSIDPRIAPYLESYVKFRNDSKFTPPYIEKSLIHPVYLYGGTIDRMGILNGRKVLIDIKSGAWCPVDDLQLAAYVGLASMNKLGLCQAFGLYLKPGGYSLKPLMDFKSQFEVFLSLLKVHNWMNGRKRLPGASGNDLDFRDGETPENSDVSSGGQCTR